MAVAAKKLRSPGTQPLLERCTELLSVFAGSGDRRVFDQLANFADAFLVRRAHVEIAKRRAGLDASEVVQEALLNIYRYAKSFRPTVPHAFATWASRIVANVVLRLMRPRRTARPVSIDDVEGWELPSPPEHDPVRRLGDDEDRVALRRHFGLWLRIYYEAFLGLTQLQQSILHRVEILGQSYAEIAREMGMRVEAVKMVVYRGRKKLQIDMQRYAGA